MRQLRIGHLSTFYHTAIILMADRDLAEKIGAEPVWTLFGTGPAIVDAFERRELDIAYIGLPPAIIGIARGVAIRCIAGGHIEGTVLSGKKEYLSYPELPDLGSVLNQFRGKSIGVPGKGSIHDVILARFLAHFGLADSIRKRNFAWADQVTEAMARNEIAAAVGTPALAVAVEDYAGGRLLFPAAALWPHNPSYGILASREFLEQEQHVAGAFLSAHENATRMLREQPEESSALIAREIGFVDPGFVRRTLAVSPKYCAKITREYIQATMEFVRSMRALGYLAREIDGSDIFDLSLIDRIHPEAVHY